MKEIIEQLEKQYAAVRNEEYDLAIKISLAGQGIYPAKVSRRHIDMIRTLNYRIEDIKAKANQNIFEVQQEASADILEVQNRLVEINREIRKAQGLQIESESKD